MDWRESDKVPAKKSIFETGYISYRPINRPPLTGGEN